LVAFTICTGVNDSGEKMIKITSQHHYCLLEPLGPLTSDDFKAIAQHIDPIIEGGGRLHGLMIKTRSFPGWESLGDVIEHIRFVKNHHRAIDRVALVSDTPLAHIFPAIVGHFVSAQVRQFDFDDYEAAVVWMQSTDPQN
jgi:hypothetical protein